MEISARNQIRGRVVEVRMGITAAITTSSSARLGLKDGDEVTVIIKSTEVLIGK